MVSLKLLFIACLIFDFSLCVNEANELKNTFTPSGGNKYKCINNVGTITIQGGWGNDNAPESLSFTLHLTDGHNLPCSYTSQDPNGFTCSLDHVKFKYAFDDQYMDENQEYLLKGYAGSSNFDCLSSYIYSNLLLLFIIIFILFN